MEHDDDIDITYMNRQLARGRKPKVTAWHRDALHDCRDKVRWAESEPQQVFREVATTLRKLPEVMRVLSNAVERFDDINSQCNYGDGRGHRGSHSSDSPQPTKKRRRE